MNASPYSRELDVARALALDAGRLILGYHRTGLTVDRKAGDEPVTRADREASDLILAGLARAFPDDVLISEEGPDDTRRLEPSRRVWYIDPLDGTRDFIHGRDGFAVMIGLVVDGRPRVGAVYQPTSTRLYLAATGAGATLVEAGVTRALACSTVSEAGSIRMVSSRSHRTDEVERVKTRLGVADELQIGSVGIKLGLIALGERDLYVNPGSRCKAWDTCAPEAILDAAGGRLTDLRGRPVRYDALELAHGGGLVATNGLLHAQVLARLAELFPTLA